MMKKEGLRCPEGLLWLKIADGMTYKTVSRSPVRRPNNLHMGLTSKQDLTVSIGK
jgi:hypothetical protein